MSRETQSNRILHLLENYKLFGYEWLPLPKILSLGIASHTRRISDLRKRGYNIECRRETIDGQVQTKYRLMGWKP